MTRRTRETKKPAPKAPRFPRKQVPLEVVEGESDEARQGRYAKLFTSTELAAYRVMNASEQNTYIGDLLDVPALFCQLRKQSAAVNRGDLSQVEAMLTNQAIALQSLFARLTELSMGADLLQKFETYLRLGLRAQSQCRATLETLAAIKNPPVVYARQANITNGPQQVNNVPASSPRAGENEIPPSKLLEVTHGQRLDTGTQGAASGVNQDLEAVGAIHRAND